MTPFFFFEHIMSFTPKKEIKRDQERQAHPVCPPVTQVIAPLNSLRCKAFTVCLAANTK